MNTSKITINHKRPGETFLGTYLGAFGKPYNTEGVLDLADHLESQALILLAQAEETRAAADLLRSGALVRATPPGDPAGVSDTQASAPCSIHLRSVLGVSEPPDNLRGLDEENIQRTTMEVQQDDEDFIRLCIPDRVNGTTVTLVINPTSWSEAIPIANFFKHLAKLTLAIGAWREWKGLCPICEEAMSDFLADDVSYCEEIPHPGRPCPACAEAMNLASIQTSHPAIQWNGQTNSGPGATRPIKADQKEGE